MKSVSAWLPTLATVSVAFFPLRLSARADVQITVDVNVREADGTPVSDAPVQASTLSSKQFAFSDANGDVTFSLTLDDSNPQIVACVWSGAGSDLSIPEARHAHERYDALTQEYAFPLTSVAFYEPGTTSYTLDIVGASAIVASGTLTLEDGSPCTGVILVRGFRAYQLIQSSNQGQFQIGGVPMSQSVELMFGDDDHRIHFLPLSAAQTQGNIDLGGIVLDYPPADATVHVEVTNRANFFGFGGADLGDSVTLIRDDAQFVQYFPINGLDAAMAPSAATPLGNPTVVPAGTYYVSPGTIGKALPLALLDAIRDGRQAALDAAGVPKLAAVAGQTTTLSFDARSARDAILSVASDLMPQP